VLSENSGLVFKHVVGGNERAGLSNEVSAWEYAHRAGITGHVPELYEWGRVDKGGYWTITQLVPNLYPVDRLINPFRCQQKIWCKWLRLNILPVLHKFYEEAGWRVLSPDDWLRNLVEKIECHPCRQPLLRIINLAESALASCDTCGVPYVQLHGDLHPRHLHRNKEDWRIIDWGDSYRGCISYDFFCLVFENLSYNEASSEEEMLVWKWLRGETELPEAPEMLQPFASLYTSWLAGWMGLHISPNCIRFHIIGTIIERICMRWTMFGLSFNMKDTKGQKYLQALRISLD
jgi:hypothetical protein